MAEESSSQDTARRLYEDAEKQTASAMEQLVGSNSFGELLARSTENVMALTKIGFGTADLVVRNLRIAGRKDVVQLGRQLARTEDKLERVLQEVEQLRDELKQERASSQRSTANRSRSTSRSKSNGSTNGSGSRKKSSGTRSKSSS
jgi:hypothetical protein